MHALYRIIGVFCLVFLPFGSYAHDCETELGESMRSLKDSMRAISRAARKNDTEALRHHATIALGYVEESRKYSPEGFASLHGNDLQEAEEKYQRNLDELEKHLTDLQVADGAHIRTSLDEIQSLQKSSHKAFKDC